MGKTKFYTMVGGPLFRPKPKGNTLYDELPYIPCDTLPSISSFVIVILTDLLAEDAYYIVCKQYERLDLK